MQYYLLNRTYIAEDRTTGLVAYGVTQDEAHKALTELVADYWEERKVIVPINQANEQVSVQKEK